MQPSTNLIQWLANGARGISSNTIVEYLTGIEATTYADSSTPSDPADLRRCRLLLERCPELMIEFPRMAEVSDVWAKLVENWAELCATMDTESPEWRDCKGVASATYEMMKQLGC
jgi:predicted nucleic acid-binding protein